jgi:excisionase family DNA binding protein
LTKKELMDLTGWSSRTVEYKKAEGIIPYVRQGRLCLFPTDEILAWLEEGRVPMIEVQR